MRKKLLPLIGIAFVVAIISTALFYSLLAGRLSGATGNRTVEGTLVTAAHDLKTGTVLAASDLATIRWNGGDLPKGAYETRQQVEGKTVFDPIPQGEPVLASRLLSKDGVGVGIPEGMRAVSVHVSDSSGVVGLLRPGYKVDIQVFGAKTANGAAAAGLRTPLKGVTVLAISPQPETSSQGYFAAPVVTLLVTAQDAGELARADSYERVRLSLRNPLEPVAGEAAPPDSEPEARNPRDQRVGNAGDRVEGLSVQMLSLTDQGLSVLSQAGDIAGAGAPPQVGTRKAVDIARLIEQGVAKISTEATIPARAGRFAYFDVPRGETAAADRVRIGLLRSERQGCLRIRPEIRGMHGQRMEARTLETEVVLQSGYLAVVSGVAAGASQPFRHIVILISRGKAAS